jgi:hypothetical protein
MRRMRGVDEMEKRGKGREGWKGLKGKDMSGNEKGGGKGIGKEIRREMGGWGEEGGGN